MAIKVTHIKPENKDFRGSITRLINEPKIKIRAVLLLTHKKDTIRGNHYHKKDSHWVYCVSGKFRYYEKDVTKKNARVFSVILKSGDLVYSKPGMAHAMEAIIDTVFLAITTEKRDQRSYETDLVRINIVGKKK
jgi:dTDP-4-dehydrorhamnose 3,5-epimerase-like enzyme